MEVRRGADATSLRPAPGGLRANGQLSGGIWRAGGGEPLSWSTACACAARVEVERVAEGLRVVNERAARGLRRRHRGPRGLRLLERGDAQGPGRRERAPTPCTSARCGRAGPSTSSAARAARSTAAWTPRAPRVLAATAGHARRVPRLGLAADPRGLPLGLGRADRERRGGVGPRRPLPREPAGRERGGFAGHLLAGFDLRHHTGARSGDRSGSTSARFGGPGRRANAERAGPARPGARRVAAIRSSERGPAQRPRRERDSQHAVRDPPGRRRLRLRRRRPRPRRRHEPVGGGGDGAPRRRLPPDPGHLLSRHRARPGPRRDEEPRRGASGSRRGPPTPRPSACSCRCC